MKILMINGTMRKSSTYTIAKIFIDKITGKDDEVKELFLPKDMPEFCRGCGICFKNSEEKCPDYLIYMRRITRMIDEADLLVFTTPVFVYHVTGQMKALLDHYGYRWMVHRPESSMFKKQAVCFATAAGGGMKKALKDITDSLHSWGVAKVCTYGVAVASASWEGVDAQMKEKIEADLTKMVVKIQHDPERITPSLKVKFLFYLMRHFQKKGMFMQADRDYWEEKGWLGKVRPWKMEKEK